MNRSELDGLAVLNDRERTALLDQEGTVRWIGPVRSGVRPVMSALLSDDRDEGWTVETEQKVFQKRMYLEESGVLETQFTLSGKHFSITDWMSLDANLRGLCRYFSKAPQKVVNSLRILSLTDEHSCSYKLVNQTTAFFEEFSLFLRTSHPLQRAGLALKFVVPNGLSGWAVLTQDEDVVPLITEDVLASSRDHTIRTWHRGAETHRYDGPFSTAVNEGMRAEFGWDDALAEFPAPSRLWFEGGGQTATASDCPSTNKVFQFKQGASK